MGTDDTSTTFERELRVTEAVLRTAADLGIRQYWSLGNHEERLLRKLCHEVSMERLADMARVSDLVESGNLVVSENPSLTHGEDWILTHPAQYGSSPLAVPGYLADVEQKNLVAGHSHHWGLGKSPSGKFTVVESGGIFEPTFMRYLAHRPSKHRAQCKGFVVLDHGVPHLVDGAGELVHWGSEDESADRVRRHRASATLQSGPVFTDTETTGLNPRQDKLVLVQLYQPHLAEPILIDWRESWDNWADRLSDVFGQHLLVAHNAKFDVSVLRANGVKVGEVFCTQIAEQVLQGVGLEDARQQGIGVGLAGLAETYGVRTKPVSKAEREWFYVTLPLDITQEIPEAQLEYSAEDVRLLADIYRNQQIVLATGQRLIPSSSLR